MARHWRTLALATLAAAAVGLACVVSVRAQEPAKSAAKKAKAKAKAPEGEEAADGEEAAAKTAPAKKKRQDPAEAQRAIDAALKLLEAGKAEPAAQALSAVLTGGNLPPAIMAKALFYRGVAYRQQKLHAQAIADLTSALWLKGGLGGSDRADALRQRTSAYQEAGLAETGEPLAPAAIPNASHAPTRTASAEQSWGSETNPPASAAPKQSSGWNPFAGWFGGSSSPAASPPPPPPSAAPQTTASIEASEPSSAPPAPRPRTSAWTRNTEVHSSDPSPPAASPAPVAPSPPPVAKPEGRFRIQVGMVRTPDEAQVLAGKVRREHAAALADREPEIDQAVVGNMGSFYRVRVGPFATQQDGQAACAKLKGSGLDCLVVVQ
jgi:hypothetical protein